MTTGTFFKTKASLLAACAAFALQPNVAYAQSTQTIAYNIEAQNLGTALTELAKQSNKEIYFSSALTRGKRVARLQANLTLQQALDRLLANTGLSYRVNSNGSIVIEKGSAGASALSQSSNPATGPSGEGAPAPVTGKLTDERTGANANGQRRGKLRGPKSLMRRAAITGGNDDAGRTPDNHTVACGVRRRRQRGR